MKKKQFLAVVLSCCFALPSFAQNSELNKPYHSYGDYYMVPMSHYNNGSPRYPAIVAVRVIQSVFFHGNGQMGIIHLRYLQD